MHSKFPRFRLLSIACLLASLIRMTLGTTNNIFQPYALNKGFVQQDDDGNFDDDRHDKDPDDKDATNPPSIEGFSRLPSSLPSRSPTISPSLSDPCEQIKLNGGSFGDLDSENLLVVHFLYEVETDPIITENMLASIGDILYAVELDLSVELVKTFFPQCGGTQNPGNEIIGIHARPFDLANGGTNQDVLTNLCAFTQSCLSTTPFRLVFHYRAKDQSKM